MPNVDLWTDGACAGNPGPGGWAAILVAAGRTRELSGGAPNTTNNRQELTACIEGLRALTARCTVTIHTDSTYVLHGFEKRWLAGWKRRGWKTAAGKPVANRDLWERLDALVAAHQVTWKWHRGHTGVALNERCDVLACAARDGHR